MDYEDDNSVESVKENNEVNDEQTNNHITNHQLNNDQLDKFPDNCNIQTYRERILSNQHILIKQIRLQFLNSMEKCVEENCPNIELVFPANLLESFRKILIKEIFERFGPVTIICENINNDLEPNESCGVNNEKDIPRNPKKILIDIIKTD